MKTLLLFRHAKSDWDAKFDHDHDRPLNKRGKRAARRMGRYLSSIGLAPDQAVSSSAARATQTVSLAAQAGGWTCGIEIDDSLYEAGPQRIVEVARQQSDEAASLMLVGHEPGFSQAVGMLIGGGQVAVKTAAIALIEFDVERWRDIRFTGGTLIGLISPALVQDAPGDAAD